LLHLTIRQIHDHAAEQLDHFKVVKIGQVPTGLGKQKVTSQDSHTVVEAAVHGGHTATSGCLVDHVVVHQRGRMDHFRDLGQAAMAGGEFTLGR